jgi:hypothetical protein
MIRRLWAYLWYGRLCQRCKQERLGVWDPFVRYLVCETCFMVDRINFRAYLEKW